MFYIPVLEKANSAPEEEIRLPNGDTAFYYYSNEYDFLYARGSTPPLPDLIIDRSHKIYIHLPLINIHNDPGLLYIYTHNFFRPATQKDLERILALYILEFFHHTIHIHPNDAELLRQIVVRGGSIETAYGVSNYAKYLLEKYVRSFDTFRAMVYEVLKVAYYPYWSQKQLGLKIFVPLESVDEETFVWQSIWVENTDFYLPRSISIEEVIWHFYHYYHTHAVVSVPETLRTIITVYFNNLKQNKNYWHLFKTSEPILYVDPGTMKWQTYMEIFLEGVGRGFWIMPWHPDLELEKILGILSQIDMSNAPSSVVEKLLMLAIEKEWDLSLLSQYVSPQIDIILREHL